MAVRGKILQWILHIFVFIISSTTIFQDAAANKIIFDIRFVAEQNFKFFLPIKQNVLLLTNEYEKCSIFHKRQNTALRLVNWIIAVIADVTVSI